MLHFMIYEVLIIDLVDFSVSFSCHVFLLPNRAFHVNLDVLCLLFSLSYSLLIFIYVIYIDS